jgi:hypothetical protein
MNDVDWDSGSSAHHLEDPMHKRYFLSRDNLVGP